MMVDESWVSKNSPVVAKIFMDYVKVFESTISIYCFVVM